MSDICYGFVYAESPQDAATIFLEKERLFQEKYGFRADHMCKIESVKNLNLPNGSEERRYPNTTYFYEIKYSFRRASL